MSESDRFVLLVDDDHRTRALLDAALSRPGWRALLARTGREALAHLASGAEPAVAIVELALADMDGVSLIQEVRRRRPELPIVVATVHTEERRILDAIRAGARGYLFKEDLGQGLASALEEAIAGGAPMSRAVARLLFEQVRRSPPASAPAPQTPPVTERERQVIYQLARGLSYEEIAGALDISSNTVRSYIRAIYEKLSVSSKTEAVLAALRLGLVTGGDLE